MSMHNAEILHKFSPSTCKGITDVFNDIKDKLSWTEKESILDVGCGTGNVTATVVTKFVPPDSNIVATDISLDMIEFAKKIYNNPRITFGLLDILDSNILTEEKKQQFNKVFCFYVMQRIVDDKKAYINMFNLLKLGGEILVVFPGKHGFDEISPLLANINKYSTYREGLLRMKFHISPKEDYIFHSTKVLKNIGFDIVTCKVKPITFQLESINDFVEIYGLASRLSQILPEDLFNEAMEDIKQIIPDNNLFGYSSGICNVNYELIIVIAKKPL